MTDYSTLTDAELNKLVAQRLGWREATLTDDLFDEHKHALVMRGWACLLRPDGTLYGIDLDINKLWAYLFENEAFPATDLNAAAALDFGECVLSILVYPYNHVSLIVSRSINDYVTSVRGDMGLARAICEAWLRYRDAIGAKA